MANITIFLHTQLAAVAILDLFKVPIVLFVRHLVMFESFKNFETLIRKLQTLQGGPKIRHTFIRLITSSHIDKFSQLFKI